MSALLSIGTAVPEHGIDQTSAAATAARLIGASERRTRAMQHLYASCGVKNRHFCVADTNAEMPLYAPTTHSALGPTTKRRLIEFEVLAHNLAHRACTQALQRASTPAERITHIVTVSCTGAGSPGIDHALIGSLGLSPDVQRTHIGFMGCHAAINGLRIANALAEAAGNTVLLCCVELCSLHFQFETSPGATTANALFADGSAACVIGADTHNTRLSHFASRQFPDTTDLMSWRIGDHGFQMHLSARVPDAIEQGIGPWMNDWLASHAMKVSEIDRWVIHPGGPRIVDAAIKGLNLTHEIGDQSRALALDILGSHGNMSSPTILFMLQQLLAQQTSGTAVCLAFGPGLAGEACLVHLPHRA